MRVLDLFAGIGGFSLAAHWMGWETVAFVEKDEFCQKVLRKNFGQDIEIFNDITTFSGEPFRGRVNIVCGGFPCQPYSQAGKRKGTEDERHLWPEMLRVITEVQPRFVVGENVLGLVNWSGGLVFEQVQTDLEVAGYEVWTGVLPACAKDAPHRRDRLWFVANTARQFRYGCAANGIRRNSGSQSSRKSRGQDFGILPIGSDWALHQPSICREDDGLSNRVDRLKSLGNAIVPQIAYEIFRAIEATDMEPEPRADNDRW